MNIGITAEKSGVSVKTIRYYESVGLIKPASRAANGYRVYDEFDVQTLRFIERTRGLGFSVRDVADMLTLWHDRRLSCAEIKSRAKISIAAVERKVRETEALKGTILDLVEGGQDDHRPGDPVRTEPGRDDVDDVRASGSWSARTTVTHVTPRKTARHG